MRIKNYYYLHILKIKIKWKNISNNKVKLNNEVYIIKQ
jgi:hypothetical protein